MGSINEKFDVEALFSQYNEAPDLEEADAFHLYDTGKECAVDDSGYHDARHFKLIAFNTETDQKRDCGIHDGITNLLFNGPTVNTIRVFADGSFFFRMNKPVKLLLTQGVFFLEPDKSVVSYTVVFRYGEYSEYGEYRKCHNLGHFANSTQANYRANLFIRALARHYGKAEIPKGFEMRGTVTALKDLEGSSLNFPTAFEIEVIEMTNTTTIDKCVELIANDEVLHS